MIEVTPYEPPRVSLRRRVLGWCVAVLAVVALVGFAAGIWNPWRLVRLRQVFGDPTLGVLVVLVLVLVAFWLLAPVGSEASQPVRHMIRWLLVLSLLPAFFVWALGHTFFTVAYRQVATSPSGQRHAAFVTHLDSRELRIWVGHGLGLRDAGRAGTPCGPHAAARFVAEDVVHITSDYGDFDVRLDPKSGRPVNPMGPTCSG